MQGHLASQFPSEEGSYSDIKVMKSAAGYYIGTEFLHGDASDFCGMVEPGSRESVEYFDTYESAADALRTGNWTQRGHP